MDSRDLVNEAMTAAKQSYAPYSRFRVGAALECEDGTIVLGANVENRSFGMTICAERSAIVSAISSGKRKFTRIAIYSPDSDYPLSPCGACRQVLSEFLPPEALVVLSDKDQNAIELTLGTLLPHDGLQELKDRV